MYGDLKISSNCMSISSIASICLFFTFISCNTNTDNKAANSRPGKNEMADINKFLVQKDKERIQNYIERKNLKMTQSQTGLWFQIIYEGSGALFSDNSNIKFNYECSLLDGTKCYSSKNLGPKDIILGKSELEPGLNAGLRMLRPGAKAIFIIPPHLAFGLIGDGKKIPSRAIIVYNIDIFDATKNLE